MAILLVAKLCLLVALFRRWAEPRYRVLLLGWLALEIALSVWRMGGRRDVAMLLMVAVLLYHRQVRPLAVWQAVSSVTALLAGLLVFGFLAPGLGRADALVGEQRVPGPFRQRLGPPRPPRPAGGPLADLPE